MTTKIKFVMGGPPYYDRYATTTGYTVSTTSTDITEGYPTECTYDYSYTNSPGIGRITIISEKEESEIQEKIIELIREEIILNMKRSWTKNKKEFKPSPARKPVHRLQNICFNGRGWA